MKIKIEESRKLRRASACMRAAGEIEVKVPRHWSAEVKRRVTGELVERIRRKDALEKRLLAKYADSQTRLSFQTQAELEAFVRKINRETFNVNLGKVAIGRSRYHHLAQLNLHTKTMTVSAYCLKDAPEEALRYLIIHELAHYYESGHGPRFWALVAQFVDDYRLQSRVMKAFHHQTVISAGAEEALLDDALMDDPMTEAPKKKTKQTIPVSTPSAAYRQNDGTPIVAAAHKKSTELYQQQRLF